MHKYSMKNYKPYLIFDKTSSAKNIKNKIMKKIDKFSVSYANLVIVIGGDGFMLQTLKKK